MNMLIHAMQLTKKKKNETYPLLCPAHDMRYTRDSTASSLQTAIALFAPADSPDIYSFLYPQSPGVGGYNEKMTPYLRKENLITQNCMYMDIRIILQSLSKVLGRLALLTSLLLLSPSPLFNVVQNLTVLSA